MTLPSSPSTTKMTHLDRLKNFWYRVIALESSPRAIALGAAIGIFVAFSPAVGFHMILAAALATLFRANPVPAAAMAWISNPITIPPLFTLTYKVGTIFWTPHSGLGIEAQIQRLVEIGSSSNTQSAWQNLQNALRLGTDFFVPLWIGGAILGLALAALSYPIVLWAIIRARQTIAWRQHLRAKHSKHS